MSELDIFNLKNVCLVAGFITGCIATGTAIREISSTHFEVPCYLKPFVNEKLSRTTTSTNCCGKYQNITTIKGKNPVQFCNAPDFNFYK
jgi:hypothetical protein